MTSEHRVDNVRIIIDSDSDNDGVSDDCDLLPGCNDYADFFSDLMITYPDFALFAQDWLCTSGCTADVDVDGDNDFDDLSILAANWLCGASP